MKKTVKLLILGFVISVFNTFLAESTWAGTYRLYKAQTTSAQEFLYTQNTLNQILTPAGYELIIESIDIIQDVAMMPFQTPVIVETPEYAAHTVLFEAKKNNVIHNGIILLIIINNKAVKSSPLKDEFVLNTSAKEVKINSWGSDNIATLLFSTEVQYPYFKAEIRDTDLSLRKKDKYLLKN